MADLEKIVEEVSKLSALELSDLVKKIEEFIATRILANC